MGRHNFYKVHPGNHQGLLIIIGPPGGLFWPKVYYLVKMDSANQPGGILMILTSKNMLKMSKLSRNFCRSSTNRFNILRKVYFLVKMNSGNQPGDVPLILTKKIKIVKKGSENVNEVHQGNY